MLSLEEAPTAAGCAQGLLAEVKEEPPQETQLPGAEFSEPDLSSVVTDTTVATVSADQASDLAPAVDIQEEVTAAADLSGLGHVGEEHPDRPADLSTPSERVQAEDTSEARSGEDSAALGLVKAEVEVGDPSAEASDPAVASAALDPQQLGFRWF